MLAEGGYLRTGDLGRIDADGYIWITGRAKDLIIRGGHNIDPAMIEDAMMQHPDVAFAGAIGQPDAHSGELPAVYVELVAGRSPSEAELMAHARSHISEPVAVPKHLEILPELPKTAVGKVFKPDLRRRAIGRVFDAALAAAGSAARVAGGARGSAARAGRRAGAGAGRRATTPRSRRCSAGFVMPWRWQDAPRLSLPRDGAVGGR